MLALASMALSCIVLLAGRPWPSWHWPCPLPFSPKLVGVPPLPGWGLGWLEGASAAPATTLGAEVHVVAFAVGMLLGAIDIHQTQWLNRPR